jgi:hypothetical protein
VATSLERHEVFSVGEAIPKDSIRYASLAADASPLLFYLGSIDDELPHIDCEITGQEAMVVMQLCTPTQAVESS